MLEKTWEDRLKAAHEELDRLHKQNGNGDAPPYFALSEVE